MKLSNPPTKTSKPLSNLKTKNLKTNKHKIRTRNLTKVQNLPTLSVSHCPKSHNTNQNPSQKTALSCQTNNMAVVNMPDMKGVTTKQ